MDEPPLEITCQEVADALAVPMPGYLLIDCREEDEHATVHIASARLIPMSQIAGRIGELEPFRQRRIAVHCHHGGRSLKVALWLRSQGFSQAQSMAGGIDQWAQEIDRSLPRY